MAEMSLEIEISAIEERSIWLRTLRRYFTFVVAANLAWETAHIPLYRIWMEGDLGEIAFAIIHCAGGDLLITGATLLGALLLVGNGSWPTGRYGAVASLTTALTR